VLKKHQCAMIFNRNQFIARDYDPLSDPAGPDRADLERRYGQGEQLGP
jgi:hypothetical protein